jgi:hypothetical protein
MAAGGDGGPRRARHGCLVPYVKCSRCGLSAYTAARWSSIDACVRCDAALPHRQPAAPPNAALMAAMMATPSATE